MKSSQPGDTPENWKDNEKTSNPGNWEWRGNFRTACLIFFLLISIFSLTYSGTYIADDEHILSARTLSIVFDSQVNDERVYGNSRVYELAQLPEVRAIEALNIEPGQQFIGSIFAHLADWLQVGKIQSLFLLNILVTALTAVVLFASVLFSGYSRRIAIITALLFGLCTQAFPYSRTYFRDSLAMLFLAAAWICSRVVLIRRQRLERWVIGLAWFGLGLFLVFGIWTKNTVGIALPVIALDLLITSGVLNSVLHPKTEMMKKKALFWSLITFASLAIFFFIWIVIFSRIPLLARSSFGYYLNLFNFFLHTSRPNLLSALLGPFISLGKSIFIYSPILIVALIALFKHFRSSWSAWTYLLLLVVGQALFYDSDWWGHINWGLRYTVPAIPLLMLTVAPIIECWLGSKRGRAALVGVGAISLLIQLAGVLAPVGTYYVQLYQQNPGVSEFAAIWNPVYAAWIWHFKWLFSGGAWNLSFIRLGFAGLPIALGWMSLGVLSWLGIKRWIWNGLPILLLIASMGMSIGTLSGIKRDPAWFAQRLDLKAAEKYIAGEAQPGDFIIIDSYGTPVWYYWMNWAQPGLTWTSLPFYFPPISLIEKSQLTHNPEIALDVITLDLFKSIPPVSRVWLVVPSDTPDAGLNLESDWFALHSISPPLIETFKGHDQKTQVFFFVTLP